MDDLTLSVGAVVEVTTDRLAYGGDAVARFDGLAVFVPLAAPGERLRVRITERKKNFARAAIEEIVEPSRQRRQAPCRYFGDCGGCQLQHLTYQSQLAAKAGFVRDALERIGRLDWSRQIPIRHRDEFGYRGRAQVKVDPKTQRVGFNRMASNHVCDIVSCPILTPELDAGLASIRKVVAGATGDDQALTGLSQIELAAGESGVSFEPPLGGLPGGALRLTARGAAYNFDPSTFFQSNAGLIETLIDEALLESSGKLALDLYAGVGLFTIQLARRFQQVIAVEADARTAKHALDNISANGIENAEFYTSGVEAWLERFVRINDASPDLILLDPPRTGAAHAITQIAKLKPPRITYVSCDPATLARDLRTLVDSGYELSTITAIDLFPQTYHVETVATLSLR